MAEGREGGARMDRPNLTRAHEERDGMCFMPTGGGPWSLSGVARVSNRWQLPASLGRRTVRPALSSRPVGASGQVPTNTWTYPMLRNQNPRRTGDRYNFSWCCCRKALQLATDLMSGHGHLFFLMALAGLWGGHTSHILPFSQLCRRTAVSEVKQPGWGVFPHICPANAAAPAVR